MDNELENTYNIVEKTEESLKSISHMSDSEKTSQYNKLISDNVNSGLSRLLEGLSKSVNIDVYLNSSMLHLKEVEKIIEMSKKESFIVFLDNYLKYRLLEFGIKLAEETKNNNSNSKKLSISLRIWKDIIESPEQFTQYFEYKFIRKKSNYSDYLFEYLDVDNNVKGYMKKLEDYIDSAIKTYIEELSKIKGRERVIEDILWYRISK
ncbi:hypothetical protein YN1_3660 [Nanoarchaeota archaeon]